MGKERGGTLNNIVNDYQAQKRSFLIHLSLSNLWGSQWCRFKFVKILITADAMWPQ